jgi:hypothetical protein
MLPYHAQRKIGTAPGHRWKVSPSAPKGSFADLEQLFAEPYDSHRRVDMFVVATATFSMLYTVIVLDHHRRRVIHFELTRSPTHVWLARQITEAFSWDIAPRYLLRDRDTLYGLCF